MKIELGQSLTEGLSAGYGGNTHREDSWMGPFRLESSEHIVMNPETDEIDRHYFDHWIANVTGGGQEIARTNDETATRLYAGGTIMPEELAKLGLTKKDVTGYLKRKIVELGQGTRLSQDAIPEPDGDWQYSYQVIRRLGEIDLTIGLESIAYKGQLVFAHGFLNSPVK